MFVNAHIETKRLLVKPYHISDSKPLYELQKHPKTNRFMPSPSYSIEEIQDIILWSIEMNKKNNVNNIAKFNLSIFEKSSHKFIGYCGLGPLDFEITSTEMYYALSYDKWGKGYATEATYALLQYAFLKIGIERVVAVVFPENKASVRVLKKLGFQFEEKVKNLNEEFKEFAGMHSFYITKDVFSKNLTNNR
ncbi:GNAT family N-acetyltransferase [Bacillus thuringiensis]|uniref:GNAT family N-acetyltransferase n=1 Tax=Bacillus thuringiensis TaxID=1428 RepID=UPI000BF3FB88|nr:GNAT family N-acetyltransferase [Bacillus thuringiensis]PEV21374.1 GNAT family N-acetyltransferase [Bacillus thuringiensis]PFK54964.1 GNAT family N-acetyltransferase [Bacillus thuringiensis]PFS71804.1 GNAT family N-acetyltransferase [Bacillus thuringiensis]PFU03809.1 GNAT family N-acetyltransferase [Bacillus thuringiensis]PFU73463.1 GNAT family N-acetyltransferase [Bacillus thuringiensis]